VTAREKRWLTVVRCASSAAAALFIITIRIAVLLEHLVVLIRFLCGTIMSSKSSSISCDEFKETYYHLKASSSAAATARPPPAAAAAAADGTVHGGGGGGGGAAAAAAAAAATAAQP
jgi:hypothetical protein